MRKALSLIELVFTIVIVGVVAMSFPLILTLTSNNIAFAMQQEALLSSKTYIGTILSHDWDANSVQNAIAGGRSMVLDTNNADSFRVVGGKRRGFVEGNGRRAMSINDVGIIQQPAGASTDANNIGYFNNREQNLNVVADALDMRLDFQLSSEVNYVTDALPQGNYNDQNLRFDFETDTANQATNIKMITVRAEAPDRDINIVLRAFSSNIGEIDLLERVW